MLRNLLDKPETNKNNEYQPVRMREGGGGAMAAGL